MKDIETVVSDNIQKLMKEYNLNNVELAKIAEVSESTVGKWVLKKATPRMGAIEKISNHFNIPKSYILNEDNTEDFRVGFQYYHYLPTSISAGLPLDVEAITESETIQIPDTLMGKWAGNKEIFFSKINGDSMDRIIPDGSLIGIIPVEKEALKNGDIVVFSDEYDYSVKYFYRTPDKLIFKPYSHNMQHHEQHFPIDDGVKIHGKVVLYIVELD